MKIMYFLIRQNALSICRQHIRADNFWRRRTTFGSGGQLFRLTHQSRQAFHQTTRHNFTSGHRLCKNDTHAFTWISRRNMATNFQNRDEQRFYKILRRGVVIAVIGVFVYGALYFVIKAKREKVQQEKERRRKKNVGGCVGGDWQLTGLDGKPLGSADFAGRWYLMYFGFTHCPDICPDELDKISDVLRELDKNKSFPKLEAVFISVDPKRDTPEVMRKYCEDFHDNLTGAVGSEQDIEEMCRKWRVYYHAHEQDEDGDYIIDHSIITYLVDPEGQIRGYYMKSKILPDMVNEISQVLEEAIKPPSFKERILTLLGI